MLKSGHRTIWRALRHLFCWLGVAGGLSAAMLAQAQASTSCDAVNSGAFELTNAALGPSASSLLFAWTVGDLLTVNITSSDGVSRTDGLYHGPAFTNGSFGPLATTTVLTSGTATFQHTVTSSDLTNGIAIDPENNDSVVVGCGAPPTVTGVSPNAGPTAGGTSVTITGTNFTGVTTGVTFGGTAATSFTVNSLTQITAAAPAHSAGAVDVVVTTGAGSGTDVGSFTYVGAPTVTAVAPSAGALGGGTAVTITGTNLTGATAVKFGGNAASNVSVVNATTITATSPAGSVGTVDVTVTTPGGTSATSSVDHYTYSAAPTVSSVNPSTGPTAGGTAVTITGTNLTGATAVKFGGGTASNVSVVNATTIRATSPAGSTGIVDVTVTTPGGTSATSSADHFTYLATPTISSVSPNSGPPAGGTSVTITGTNLTGASAVAFGGTAATQFTVNSATMITATSPAEAAGTVDVTVTTGNGTSATSAADRFTYALPRMTQQGPKLVGSHPSGNAEQGASVSLSADGDTAIVGGPADSSDAGAAWIFSRNSALPVVPGSVGAPAPSVAPAAWTQTGTKLVGNGASGAAQQGYAVALSGDGNTAIVGGYKDNSGVGAVWIFARDGGSLGPKAAADAGGVPAALLPGEWHQQGVKLIAGDETGAGMFGASVALSTDGNTAIVGGYADNSGTGAAWIFTRTNGVWTQQGGKLVGSGAVGNALQGVAVALSGDGNTALVGGYGDNSDNGAAWVFVRSGTTWNQQGSKLFGSGNAGAAEQGYAVALSADGNTALVGGFADNSDTGAVWIFTQSGGVWTQVGSKLVGTGAVGAAWQGFSVALSADASTAAMAGYEDNAFNGAVWMFTQSSGTWTQFGSKLLGSGAVGAAEQGSALALSANGTTLIEGGAFDNAGAGAAWVFVANGAGAAFTATPNAGQSPLAVSFSANGLTPPMTYTVNFGDGTLGALTQGSCTGTAAAGGMQCSGSASHTYTSAGPATATLLNASGVTLAAVTISPGGSVLKPGLGSTAAPH